MTAATKLRSTKAQKDALAARQLTDEVTVLRGKIEAHPELYGGQLRKTDRIERAIFDGRLVDARELLIEIRGEMAAKDEAQSVRQRAQEQAALAEARNQPTAEAASGVRTRDGFLWLVGRKRYTAARIQAGQIFREWYAQAVGGSVKSCLADGVGGGGGDATPTEAQLHARSMVEGVRRHIHASIGASNGAALFGLLEAVCGKGETVRQLAEGDDRRSDGKIIELGFALDLAGVSLGLVRT